MLVLAVPTPSCCNEVLFESGLFIAVGTRKQSGSFGVSSIPFAIRLPNCYFTIGFCLLGPMEPLRLSMVEYFEAKSSITRRQT